MPNIKSAKKRVKVAATKSLQNRMYVSALRKNIKKAHIALETGSEDKATAVAAAVKNIDAAVSKGILHKNSAARKKSSLVRKLNGAN